MMKDTTRHSCWHNLSPAMMVYVMGIVLMLSDHFNVGVWMCIVSFLLAWLFSYVERKK